MTAFLAGFAIGLAAAMWIRWEQVHRLNEALEHHHRITRSAIARVRRLERLAQRNGNLNYAGTLEALTRPELTRPFTVESAEPAHWEDVAIQLAAYRNSGETP